MSPTDPLPRHRAQRSRPHRERTKPLPAKRVDAPASGTGLRGLLRLIDGAPFRSYRRLVGEHDLGEFRLTVLSVPPDALGGPARLRVSIDRAAAGLRGAWADGETARIVIEDSIVRAAAQAIEALPGPTAASAPGSGRVWVDAPGPELAERTTARFCGERVELALSFDLPASERRVRGQQAETILFEHVTRIGLAALLFPLRRANELRPRVEALDRRRRAADALRGKGWVALLPRPSISAPGDVDAEGLGIPTGITVFLSGGVAGAGPWLRDRMSGGAAAGGAPMILGCPVARVGASRRAFGPLDMRAFVRACPEVPNPEAHVAEGAPAPLAVAASLVEAFEAGARLFVLDEDEIPVGALGRIGSEPALIGDPPLASLSSVLASLRDAWDVSFFVASRGASELYEAADTVYVLHDGRIEDATRVARRPSRSTLAPSRMPGRAIAVPPSPRVVRVAIEGDPGRLKVAAWGARGVRVGDDLVDLLDTTLAGDVPRLRAIAALMKRAAAEAPSWRPIDELLDALEATTAVGTFDGLEEVGLFDLARPSRVEIAAALARWKRVTFRVSADRLSAKAEDAP